MTRLATALARAREEGRLALIPYLTAGDPDAATTRALVAMLEEEGADIVELGVPFSDPLADGVTLQRAAERALAGGMNLEKTLELTAEIRECGRVPIVLFTYFNPIFRMGTARFAREAARAGVDGVLVIDLPPEESGEHGSALVANGVDPIFMLSPTSSQDRVRLVAEHTRAFIYYVARTGVTGAREDLPAGLREEVARLRLTTGLPVAVGLGLSRPSHLQSLSGAADAAVVGSALVECVEAAGRGDAAVSAARCFVRELRGNQV